MLKYKILKLTIALVKTYLNNIIKSIKVLTYLFNGEITVFKYIIF